MVDLDEVESALRTMKIRSALYELVKKEVQLRGHWRQKPRGKSFKKGFDQRRKGG